MSTTGSGPQEPVERDAALAELARRYLRGHGPASDRDMARWAGLPLRDVRAGLAAIGSELSDRGDGVVALSKAPPAAELPPPRLLGAFEPVLLGWVSREDILGRHRGSVTVGGIFRPFAIAGGRAVATWRLVKGRVEIEPFGRISKEVRSALDADAAEVERFMDGG